MARFCKRLISKVKTAGLVYLIPLIALSLIAISCAFVDDILDELSDGNSIFANDTTSPSIDSTSPSSDANNVSLNRSIEIFFSEPMDTGSAEGAFSIDPYISGSFTWDSDSETLIFTPDSSYDAQTTYAVTISTEAKDTAGNARSSDYNWSFTTGTDYDLTPPNISSVNPVNGVIDVAVTSLIDVTFTEPMDPSSINITTFIVNDGYTDIAGTVSYSGNTATFIPTTNLSYSTTYTVMVGGGVSDSSGNVLGNDYIWIFTTEVEIDVTPPAEVTNINAVSGNGQIILTWNSPLDFDFDHCEVFYGTGGVADIQFLETIDSNGTIINGLLNRSFQRHSEYFF